MDIISIDCHSDIRQNGSYSNVISIEIKFFLYQGVAHYIFTFVCHSERSEESQTLW